MITTKFRNALPPNVAREFDHVLATLRAFLAVSFNADGTLITTPSASVSEAGFPVGTMIMWSSNTVPNSNWLLCNGQAVSRSTYAGLFAVCSTTFGVGDGSTTFNVPDMRGQYAFGKAASGTGSSLGSTFGAVDHTHSGPSHTHTGPSHTHTGPSHTHTGPSHTHDVTVPRDGWGSSTAAAGRLLVSDGGALPAGTVTAAADRTFTSVAGGTGATGAEGTGATGAEGTGASGASGAGNTGTANPPSVAVNFLILAQ